MIEPNPQPQRADLRSALAARAAWIPVAVIVVLSVVGQFGRPLTVLRVVLAGTATTAAVIGMVDQGRGAKYTRWTLGAIVFASLATIGLALPPVESAVNAVAPARPASSTAQAPGPVDLSGRTLTPRELAGVRLIGSRFVGTTFPPRANLRGVEAMGAGLRDAQLNGADLTGARLRGVDAEHADFRGTTLRAADLTGAVLRDACLRAVDLRGVTLIDADWTGADLTGAVLPTGLSAQNLTKPSARACTS